MKRGCVLLVIAMACGGKKAAPPGAGSAGSAGAGSGSAGVGSGGAVRAGSDADIEAFLTDFMAYGDKSVVMLAKFDGNCGAMADQMLTLEPLAQRIRTRRAAIDSARLQDRMRDLKPKVLQHYQALLAPLGMTLADVGKKEAEMKAKCGSDPKWRDAQERTGLMKKHR